MSSTSPRAIADEARAAQQLRASDDLSFGSVKHAAKMMFERAPSMQAPLTQHPRGYPAADGSTVYLQVDGGRGGSIDDVLATLQTTHAAFAALAARSRVAHDILVLHWKWDLAFEKIEDIANGVVEVRTAVRADITTALPRSAVTISRLAAEGVAFLYARLRSGGIVRSGPEDAGRALREAYPVAWVVWTLQRAPHQLLLREIERYARLLYAGSRESVPHGVLEIVDTLVDDALPRDPAALSKHANLASAFMAAWGSR